jgi:hypothetical protein
MPRPPRTGEQTESGPPRLPSANPPYPSSDYSFTLQAVMEMQKILGGLTQAVNTLTEQQKEHGAKLENIGKDVHGARVALKIIATIGIGLATILGWLLARAWDIILKHYVTGSP